MYSIPIPPSLWLRRSRQRFIIRIPVPGGVSAAVFHAYRRLLPILGCVLHAFGFFEGTVRFISEEPKGLPSGRLSGRGSGRITPRRGGLGGVAESGNLSARNPLFPLLSAPCGLPFYALTEDVYDKKGRSIGFSQECFSSVLIDGIKLFDDAFGHPQTVRGGAHDAACIAGAFSAGIEPLQREGLQILSPGDAQRG